MKNIIPQVSVIMNCYNGEKYLKQSLNSLVNQSFKNWELIFWNNKSNDRSEKILKNFKDKRIKYFKSKNFTKLYRARNLAIQKAKGKYICFLDVDDWWVKQKLQMQINFLNENKKAGFVFSNLYVFNQNNKKTKLYFSRFIPSGKITQILLNDYKIGILTVMMKKKFFDKKKFNNNYNIIGDFDFFINLSLKENFFCIQKPLAYYRVHKKNFSKESKIYTEELKKWFLINSKILKKKRLSLFKLKLYYLKLKFKNFLRMGS